MDQNSRQYNEKEAAEYLRISKMSLIRRRNEGKIRYFKVGNKIVYGERHLEEYLRACERGGESIPLSTTSVN